MIKPLLRKSVRSLALAAIVAACTGCHRIDNHRLNVAYVNLQFWTAAEWDIYGVTGAGQYKTFVRELRIPADYPYTAMSATGMGGLLLCTTYLGVPVCYDMACPVECRASVRVFVNEDGEAECPQCGSRYDIYEKMGYPVYGQAAEDGYGLQIYSVGPGTAGEYMVVRI